MRVHFPSSWYLLIINLALNLGDMLLYFLCALLFKMIVIMILIDTRVAKYKYVFLR